MGSARLVDEQATGFLLLASPWLKLQGCIKMLGSLCLLSKHFTETFFFIFKDYCDRVVYECLSAYVYVHHISD